MWRKWNNEPIICSGKVEHYLVKWIYDISQPCYGLGQFTRKILEETSLQEKLLLTKVIFSIFDSFNLS